MKPQTLFQSSSTADPEGNVIPSLVHTCVPMILTPEFYKTILYSLWHQEHLREPIDLLASKLEVSG